MVEYVAYLAAQERVAARAAEALPAAHVDAAPRASRRWWLWLRLRRLGARIASLPATSRGVRRTSQAVATRTPLL